MITALITFMGCHLPLVRTQFWSLPVVNMEATGASDMNVPFYQPTWNHKPEDIFKKHLI